MPLSGIPARADFSYKYFVIGDSTNFVFSIFLYFTLGTFCFTLAALKQVLAMSVLMLAMPALERKQWLLYYFLCSSP